MGVDLHALCLHRYQSRHSSCGLRRKREVCCNQETQGGAKTKQTRTHDRTPKVIPKNNPKTTATNIFTGRWRRGGTGGTSHRTSRRGRGCPLPILTTPRRCRPMHHSPAARPHSSMSTPVVVGGCRFCRRVEICSCGPLHCFIATLP